MTTIRLQNGEWEVDTSQRLGAAGGFGEVFVGRGARVGEVAVKRLKLSASQAAHREMRIAQELAGRAFRHVIPVFDAGQDAESDAYFVVMARAQESLQEELNSGVTFDGPAAAGILLQILSGLDEVAQITHRDLKPANVLFHGGVWKIADFGIARFVEEATSSHTLNNFLSAPYAAPEQWREERASAATDVYALGCIAFALLTGRPPFPGPSRAEFRHQHLHEVPQLRDPDARLASLVLMMLRKAPEVRPTRARLETIFEHIQKNVVKTARTPGPLAAVASVSAKVAERVATQEAQFHAEKATAVRRDEICREALRILVEEIIEPMLQRIAASAPMAKVSRDRLSVQLDRGMLSVMLRESAIGPGAFVQSKWDVITAATIAVAQKEPNSYHWEASLWFGDIQNGAGMRWYEVSYFDNPARRTRRAHAPFGLGDDVPRADEAAGPAMSIYQIAFGPVPIDTDGTQRFWDRWTALFVKACEGQLAYPRDLPLSPVGV